MSIAALRVEELRAVCAEAGLARQRAARERARAREAKANARVALDQARHVLARLRARRGGRATESFREVSADREP